MDELFGRLYDKMDGFVRKGEKRKNIAETKNFAGIFKGYSTILSTFKGMAAKITALSNDKSFGDVSVKQMKSSLLKAFKVADGISEIISKMYNENPLGKYENLMSGFTAGKTREEATWTPLVSLNRANESKNIFSAFDANFNAILSMIKKVHGLSKKLDELKKEYGGKNMSGNIKNTINSMLEPFIGKDGEGGIFQSVSKSMATVNVDSLQNLGKLDKTMTSIQFLVLKYMAMQKSIQKNG